MPRGSHSFRVKVPNSGFERARPRVPTIVSAGVVLALLAALIIAGLFLSTELIDPSTLEEGADTETLVASGAVLGLTIGFGILLTYMLRRFFGASQPRKDSGLTA